MYKTCRSSIMFAIFTFVWAPGMAHATAFTFTPTNPTETHSLSDIFDDDVGLDHRFGQHPPLQSLSTLASWLSCRLLWPKR